MRGLIRLTVVSLLFFWLTAGPSLAFAAPQVCVEKSGGADRSEFVELQSDEMPDLVPRGLVLREGDTVCLTITPGAHRDCHPPVCEVSWDLDFVRDGESPSLRLELRRVGHELHLIAFNYEKLPLQVLSNRGRGWIDVAPESEKAEVLGPAESVQGKRDKVLFTRVYSRQPYPVPGAHRQRRRIVVHQSEPNFGAQGARYHVDLAFPAVTTLSFSTAALSEGLSVLGYSGVKGWRPALGGSTGYGFGPALIGLSFFARSGRQSGPLGNDLRTAALVAELFAGIELYDRRHLNLHVFGGVGLNTLRLEFLGESPPLPGWAEGEESVALERAHGVLGLRLDHHLLRHKKASLGLRTEVGARLAPSKGKWTYVDPGDEDDEHDNETITLPDSPETRLIAPFVTLALVGALRSHEPL